MFSIGNPFNFPQLFKTASAQFSIMNTHGLVSQKKVFAFLRLCLLTVTAVYPAVYYVNNKCPVMGDGTTPDTAKGVGLTGAWNSLEPVNLFKEFQPGDSILIARGTGVRYTVPTPVWRGTVGTGYLVKGVLAPEPASGTEDNPIILDAYGSGNGRPVIDAQGLNHTAGILLYNCEHWIIRNMEIVNGTSKTPVGERYGIYVYFPESGDRVYEGIAILNNHVHDIYASNIKGVQMYITASGIRVWAEADKLVVPYTGAALPNTRMKNILIEGNTVENIRGEGITVMGESFSDKSDGKDVVNWNNLSQNVVIRKNTVTNVCDGIYVTGCDNVLIEHNTVDNAGGTGDPNTIAICGIWPQASRDGIIQFNEVRNTRMLPGDGYGFHTDIHASGTSIFQYNYSHGNEGGFFSETWSEKYDDPENLPRTILRYNVSVNDALKQSSDGARTIWLNLGRAEVYNNTFYSTGPIRFGLLSKKNGTRKKHPPYEGLPNKIRNNIFVSSNNKADWGDGIYWHGKVLNSYDNNCYSPNLATPVSDSNAINQDPLFKNPGSSRTGMGAAYTYGLQAASPCINKGITIKGNGGRDFSGTAISGNPDIGAFEFLTIAPTTFPP